jgi:hypothetical protein
VVSEASCKEGGLISKTHLFQRLLVKPAPTVA